MDEKLIEAHEIQTEVTVMQVFEYMLANNVNRKEACDALHIGYSTMNRKLAENPDMLKEFLAKQRSVIELNLSQILMAQQEIMKKLMEDASDEELSMTERISLYNHLSMLQEKFARNLGVETEQEKGAREWLKGARLQPGTAKVTKTETTEIVIEVDGQTENIHQDIVDGDVKELPPKSPNDFLDEAK